MQALFQDIFWHLCYVCLSTSSLLHYGSFFSSRVPTIGFRRSSTILHNPNKQLPCESVKKKEPHHIAASLILCTRSTSCVSCKCPLPIELISWYWMLTPSSYYCMTLSLRSIDRYFVRISGSINCHWIQASQGRFDLDVRENSSYVSRPTFW
jgi:hypothetical protein